MNVRRATLFLPPAICSYRKFAGYAASVANPLAAIRRLKIESGSESK